MTNFEVELERLVNEWRKRGDDPQSMLDALLVEAERMRAVVSVRPKR